MSISKLWWLVWGVSSLALGGLGCSPGEKRNNPDSGAEAPDKSHDSGPLDASAPVTDHDLAESDVEFDEEDAAASDGASFDPETGAPLLDDGLLDGGPSTSDEDPSGVTFDFSGDDEGFVVAWAGDGFEPADITLSHDNTSLDTEGTLRCAIDWDANPGQLGKFFIGSPLFEPLDLTGQSVGLELYLPGSYVSDGAAGFKLYLQDGSGRKIFGAWRGSSSLLADAWSLLEWEDLPTGVTWTDPAFDLTQVVAVGLEVSQNGSELTTSPENDLFLDYVQVSDPIVSAPQD